jgi:hypothetical protein
MRVIMQRLRNAAMNRHPGSNFSGAGDDDRSDVESWRGCVWGTSSFGSSLRDCVDGVAMKTILCEIPNNWMSALVTVVCQSGQKGEWVVMILSFWPW